MKKTLTLFLCIAMLCSVLGFSLTACKPNEKTPSSIEVVEPKTDYFVNDVINYDALKLKVVYSDKSEKTDTVKAFKATVTVKADLSKAGNTSYKITYEGLSCEVNITVQKTEAVVTAIEVDEKQTAYTVGDTIDYDSLKVKVSYSDGSVKQDTVKNLGITVKNEADLSKKGTTSYTLSLGNVKKEVKLEVLLPYFMSFNIPDFYSKYLINSKTRGENDEEKRGDFRKTGEVYEVGNVNKFIFCPVIDALDANDNDITFDNPETTVKVFEKAAIDGVYKELSSTEVENAVIIEDNTYKFSDTAAGKYYKLEITPNTEFFEVDVAVEDMTISVELFVVGGGYNVYEQLGLSVMNDLTSAQWIDIWKCDIGENYELTARADSVKLAADDKPLCEYVGNIDWVVLHTTFTLNADDLPDSFFWTENTEGYKTANSALTSQPESQKLLVGSLRDGVGNDIQFRIINGCEEGVNPVLNFGLNPQKGFYSTYNVSVSGNYNGIVVPAKVSANGRNFFSVLDHAGNVTNPSPHWNVFQMYQSQVEGKQKSFTLKNIAMNGNGGQVTTADVMPASLNMLNCFGSEINIKNIVGNSFYTNVACDGYCADTVTNGFNAEDVKLYDAYSNMFYMWRANVSVKNSELIGSGGPLFILCDGNNTSGTEGGPVLTVDEKSKLEAYAVGNESWYSLYNAQSLVMTIKNASQGFEKAFNQVGKTVRFSKNVNGNYSAWTSGTAVGTGEYVNVIAAMICEPSDLFFGLNDAKIIVRGKYQTVDKNGDVIELFDARNAYVQALSAVAGGNGKAFAPVFQTGSLMAYTNTVNLNTLDFATGESKAFDQVEGYKWMTDTNNKMGIYMSTMQAENSPYFGIVVGSAQYR